MFCRFRQHVRGHHQGPDRGWRNTGTGGFGVARCHGGDGGREPGDQRLDQTADFDRLVDARRGTAGGVERGAWRVRGSGGRLHDLRGAARSGRTVQAARARGGGDSEADRKRDAGRGAAAAVPRAGARGGGNAGAGAGDRGDLGDRGADQPADGGAGGGGVDRIHRRSLGAACGGAVAGRGVHAAGVLGVGHDRAGDSAVHRHRGIAEHPRHRDPESQRVSPQCEPAVHRDRDFFAAGHPVRQHRRQSRGDRHRDRLHGDRPARRGGYGIHRRRTAAADRSRGRSRAARLLRGGVDRVSDRWDGGVQAIKPQETPR